MRVHHAGLVIASMDTAVNKKCSGFHLIFAGDDLAFAIENDQIIRRDFRPMKTLRVDQKMIRMTG